MAIRCIAVRCVACFAFRLLEEFSFLTTLPFWFIVNHHLATCKAS